MMALHLPHQNPKLNHLHPPFDGKAPTIQVEHQGCRYREQEIQTAMIQVEVVTEECVVRTVQGSMAVDPEGGRLKVSRCNNVGHQPKEHQQYWVHFCCPFCAGLCFERAY